MDNDEILQGALERWDEAWEFEFRNRGEMLRDLEMYAGEQWDERARREREQAGRPCLTMNRLPQFVRQVVNEARLRPPGIRVVPQDSGADVKTAKTLTGLVRNIEAASQAEVAYVTALESATICGIGHFRVQTEYADEDAWEQDIRIRPISDPFSVLWDPGARRADKQDAQFCFVLDLLTRREFEARYPDASSADWASAASVYGTWYEGDFVRVCEYWYRKPRKKKLVLTAQGETLDASKIDAATLGMMRDAGMIVREREVESSVVCQALLSHNAVLEGPTEWPGKYIPIVPVIGEEIKLSDRVVRRGLVRGARDAQIMFNLHRSVAAEAVAMAPKAKWLGTADQIAGREQQWATANVNNEAVLIYTPDPLAGGPPQRIAPEMPSAAVIQEAAQAAQDMEATTGIYRTQVGDQSNEVSGKAIMARLREGDVGTYGFIDNLARSVEMCGRIIVDLLPRIYDTERQARILEPDGSTEFVPLNYTDPATGEIINDLTRGKYDVTVSVGPSFTSRREEARESMMAFMQAMPQSAAMVADLFAKANDWESAEEMARRLRMPLIAQGVVEPEGDEQPPPPPQPGPEQMLGQAEMMKAQAQMLRAQADMMKAEVEVRKLETETGKMRADVGVELLKIGQKQAEITNRDNKARADSMIGAIRATR
jgi:hypothetical protein